MLKTASGWFWFHRIWSTFDGFLREICGFASFFMVFVFFCDLGRRVCVWWRSCCIAWEGMCAKLKSSSTPCIEEAAAFLVLLLSFSLGFRRKSPCFIRSILGHSGSFWFCPLQFSLSHFFLKNRWNKSFWEDLVADDQEQQCLSARVHLDGVFLFRVLVLCFRFCSFFFCIHPLGFQGLFSLFLILLVAFCVFPHCANRGNGEQ